jgi:hypothetical protein
MVATGVISAILLLPLYGFFVFVVEDTNAEYRKAAMSYGSPVPMEVEGGNPFFILAGALLWVLGLAAGGVAIAMAGTLSGLTRRTAVLFAVAASAAVLVGYAVAYMITGPFWPPPTPTATTLVS